MKEVSPATGTIIKTRAGNPFSAATMTNWFFHLYQDLGFEGVQQPFNAAHCNHAVGADYQSARWFNA